MAERHMAIPKRRGMWHQLLAHARETRPAVLRLCPDTFRPRRVAVSVV